MNVEVTLAGPLGAAIAASRRGRLSTFIVDEASAPLRLFAPEQRDRNVEGDWYGEHAGKWLVAAARAAAAGDGVLRERVLHVARWLVAQQTPEGYLGTYAASHRFTRPQPPKPRSWDGAPARRTWDAWVHAYVILGLLEVHRHFPEPALLDAACRIGDLFRRALVDNGIAVTSLGNHHGLSATVLIDAFAQLHADSGEPRFLRLALHALEDADEDPDLALLRKAMAGADAAEIATGKAYQLMWNCVGLTKLARATGREDLRRAVDRLWTSVRTHHLTPGGGPWGGVAHRSREVFNAPGTFSPEAYVETCSTLAWIQLNRELLALTGEPRYAGEIERSAYNDLLAAAAPDGEDWCYYTFPNGRRVHTTRWRCCKSSGAMALEELPLATATLADEGGVPTLAWHLLGPGTARVTFDDGSVAEVRAEGRYPFEGELRFTVRSERPLRLKVRVPGWAEGARWQDRPAGADTYVELIGPGGATLQLPLAPRTIEHSHRNVQESRAPDGAPVRQEVLRHGYVAFARGPLVYACGLVDGWKASETVRPPLALHVEDDDAGEGPTLSVGSGGRAPIAFVPAYRAGGRTHGAWRLTWLSLPPAEALPVTEEPETLP